MAKKTGILIVEDSPTQAILLQDLLEKNNFHVDAALNGKQALTMLETIVVDLVITDIVMPEMDGYELCRAIKSDEKLKEIPVFLLTTLSEPDDIINGLACGASHFVTKPYDNDALISAVQYAMINRDIRSRRHSELGLEVFFAGQRHFINAERIQILDLLFSSYENAILQKKKLEQVNKELEKTNEELVKALKDVKTLKGLIPICSNCKKIRDDTGFWNEVEVYVQEHSNAEFSHGLCPDCAKKLYPELYAELYPEKE